MVIGNQEDFKIETGLKFGLEEISDWNYYRKRLSSSNGIFQRVGLPKCRSKDHLSMTSKKVQKNTISMSEN